METKAQIRRRILSLRDASDINERIRLSDIITLSLFSKDLYRKAKKILLFASYKSEVDTWEIFRQAVADTKEVYFPKCIGEDMVFYRVRCEADLKEGYRGILEPEADECNLFCDFEREDVLMIMPGAAFDTACHRIGYGGGFYDRFLAKGFAGKKIAIGFDFQLLRDMEIPAEETDVKPDYILTDACMISGIHSDELSEK